MIGIGKTDATDLLARILTPTVTFMKHLRPSEAAAITKFACWYPLCTFYEIMLFASPLAKKIHLQC